MDTNLPQNNIAPTKPSLWVANPHLKMLLLVLIFVFLASGIGLAVFAQINIQYRQKIYEETQASLPKHQVKTPSAPVVLADGRLEVDSPKEGDAVGQTFTVSGYAQSWFEGNIAIKVFDASNTPLYIGNAIAGDNYGHPAPFTSSITLTATSTTPTGRIEFNDYSEKDGSLVYQKVVNIKFSDFNLSGWKTYKNNQYGFEFQYPSAWIFEVDESGATLNSPENAKCIMCPLDLIIAIDKNPEKLSAQKYYDGNPGIQAFDNPSLDKQIILDNRTAYHLFPMTGESPSEMLIIPIKDVFVRLDTRLDIDQNVILKEILSTFKLTK